MNPTLERRMRASWRTRACAAGLCVGTQLFLFGTSIAMPIAQNGLWLAALPALFLAALTACASRRALSAPRQVRPPRLLLALLAFALWLSAAFALVSLIVLAQQTLLAQARALTCAAVTLAFALLCALPGGTGICRVCFALRWALPVLALALTASQLGRQLPDGLFPLLGTGTLPLAVAALCMLGAAAPALLLLMPPPEIADKSPCPVPPARFFVLRVLAGAAVGLLMLLFSDAYTSYRSIPSDWGARVRFALQPHDGVAQTLLTLLQVLCTLLCASCQLTASAQALARAWPRLRSGALLIPGALLGVLLATLLVVGFTPALFAAPAVLLPTVLLVLLSDRIGGISP